MADPGLPDTRAEMTEEAFEFNAANAGDFISLGATFVDHLNWLDLTLPTGESSQGDGLYRFPGFNMPQRALLMWTQLHSQTWVNGFVGYVKYVEDEPELAKALIRELGWHELSKHFEPAIDEYVSDPRNGDPPSVLEDEVHWPKVKPAFRWFVLRNLWPKWLLPNPNKLTIRGKLFTPDVILKLWFMRAVDLGKFHAPGNPYYEHVRNPRPSTMRQDAFEAWFARDATQKKARRMVEAYIRANREHLSRLPATDVN